MSDLPCDALVFFGASGDLAYKKIFPSLQTMVKRGVPLSNRELDDTVDFHGSLTGSVCK